MSKYSIITPCYNSWKFMKKYLDSMERQTFQDFEIVIVDDCSEDNTYESMIKYKNSSKLNIVLISNDTNSGPGFSRNRGMREATGDWITFVDSDDWIDIDLLKKVDEIVRNYKDIHCIIYDYFITKDNNSIKMSSIYGNYDEGMIPLDDCISVVRDHVVGKFYRSNKVKKIRFPKLNRCEDIAFVARAIDACGAVYYLKDALYYYNQREGSLSNNLSIGYKDIIKAFRILNRSLGKKYPEEIYSKSVLILLYGVVLNMCKSGENIGKIMQYIHVYEKQYPKWTEADIIPKLGKAKRVFLFNIKIRNVIGIKMFALLHSMMIK